ncbi:arginine--tRNA ligase [Candidatus Woesearchaeota archaeon]|nr:arginine--tRNA ligase [Candidatus Woesearchaeota archaeon]
MTLRQQFIQFLAKNTPLPEEELNILVATPPDPKLGDYSLPCFKLGKKPHEAAEKLKQKLKLPTYIAKAEVVGPYLNFHLNHTVIAAQTLTAIFNEKKLYGTQGYSTQKKSNKTILIDFSSPNIAKPFGIGHLRSTVIGNSLSKIFTALGYNVVSVNHLGDWGTQFGKLIVAYKKWGKEKELESKPIHHLLDLYVRFHKEVEIHKEAEKNTQLEEEARKEFKRLEDGNKESIALWESFRELSLEEFQHIYHILDVSFDSYHGEAFYSHLLDKTIKELQKKVPTKISEGALIVDLEKYRLSPVMLRKSNGTTTYHTRDLAAAFYRLKHYKPHKVIYVVGSEQKLHFQQLFKVLELANVRPETFLHVDFGLFHFPEGKMSTRTGKVIFLEEVLDKAIALATKIIEEKNPALRNKEEVAKQVGVGAIIFADLVNDRIRDVDFDWQRMLSFEGETGPYLQYTHARACSILRKAHDDFGFSPSPKTHFETLVEEEKKIITLIVQFPDVIVKAAESYKPHHLAQYLVSLAHAFNEFYHACPVISEQTHTMKARLLLVDCTRQVLENGLNLLGIKAPREM